MDRHEKNQKTGFESQHGNSKPDYRNIIDYIDDEELNDKLLQLYVLRKGIKKRLDEIENEENIENRQLLPFNTQTENDKNLNNDVPFKRLINENNQNRFGIFHDALFNRIRESSQKDIDIDPSRLLALSDGIFGMVMTILAFAIGLPTIHMNSSHDILMFLGSILPNIGTILVCFIIVSTFWIYHHEIIKLKNMNIIYLWLNIFYLAAICFIPFTASLICEYGNYFIAEAVFIINILIISILFALCIHYAIKHDFLVNTSVINNRKFYIKTVRDMIILTVIILIGNYYINPGFTYLFILIPVIFYICEINSNKN